MARNTDPEIEIEIDVPEGDAPQMRDHSRTIARATAKPPEGPPPLPPSAPPDFRARLAVALQTTAPDVLAAAEEAFRGVFVSSDEYIQDAVSNQLPVHLQWLLACCSPDKLREGFENKAIAVWEIRLDAERVMVFESLRRGSGEYRVTIRGKRVSVFARKGRLQ